MTRSLHNEAPVARDVNYEAQSRCCCCCCCCDSFCGVIAFAVGKWKTTCRVLLSSLLIHPCSHLFLHHFYPYASSAKLWVSSALSSSRACSAALLTARHVRRRPRAVRKFCPLSTRTTSCVYSTHHSFHALNSFPSFSSTHSSCVVISPFPSCPSWTLTFLSSSLRSS